MKKHFQLVLIFVVYFLLAIFMTYPLAFSYHRYPLFDHLEITVTFYNLWWQYWALFHLKINPWFNPIINYPDGYSMVCLLYTSPSPRDLSTSRMPSSA